MRSRGLLIVGIGAIAASLLLAVGGTGAGRMTGWSIGAPGAIMGPALSGGSGDIGMDRAVKIAQDTAASYSGGSLAADEVIEFSDNYYASIREKSTGIGAFEILIDRATGNVIREPGPDMMWNAKYSRMSGSMMSGSGATSSRPMTVTAQQAQGAAQLWLDANGVRANAKTPDSFYGFYTVDFESSGQLVGMVSVNGYAGQVGYHSWHGTFIQLKDLGA